ncbi:MAG: tetratricopeptide repeat protein, partial [Magnetococcales bacterium]|nr:tetratricopeptide repeat protein [Magnetococcales bacterium]
MSAGISILLIDLADFSRYTNMQTRGSALATLQTIATESARFFMPYGRVWDQWQPHGTGDGYCISLDSQPPQVALRYADNLAKAVTNHNRTHGQDLPLRLRMVLAHGDKEKIDDPLLSNAFTEAQRILSYHRFKQHLDADKTAILAATQMFHDHWTRDPERTNPNLALPEPCEWNVFTFQDQHHVTHTARLWGPLWSKSWDTETDAPPGSPQALRWLILLGYNLRDPLPEVTDMVNHAARLLRPAPMNLEVRMDLATRRNLRRELMAGCDLLIYYGHGNEKGELLFADGPYTASDQNEQTLLQHVQGCLLFACHGTRFAQYLPCPWVAFDGPILRWAPIGFMEAWVHALQLGQNLHQALEQVFKTVEQTMPERRSAYLYPQTLDPHIKPDPATPPKTFAERFTRSLKAWPTIAIPTGTVRFTRCPPGVAQRERVTHDLLPATPDDPYPDHNPFVGRYDLLEKLLRLPEAAGDQQRQQVVWIHGDPGIGKSALLRQLALLGRDLLFHESNQPIFLWHMGCSNGVTLDQIRQTMLNELQIFYKIDSINNLLETLIKRLVETHPFAHHVWILDDLSYLDRINLDISRNARLFVDGLQATARRHALVLTLVVSSRRPGLPAWNQHLLTLNQHEMLLLADNILARAQPDASYETQFNFRNTARQLFEYLGRSTVLFKRGLMLEIGKSSDGPGLLELLKTEGDLNNLEIQELANRLIKHEMTLLADPQWHACGFDLIRFLSCCHRLAERVGSFTPTEIARWFGSTFQLPTFSGTAETACRNGLIVLSGFNFLRIDTNGPPESYTIPPNQRISLQGLIKNADPADLQRIRTLPARAPTNRISMVLELLEQGHVPQASEELRHIIDEYQPQMKESEFAVPVLTALTLQSEIQYQSHSDAPVLALHTLNQINTLDNQHSTQWTASPATSQALTLVAMAMKKKREIQNHNNPEQTKNIQQFAFIDSHQSSERQFPVELAKTAIDQSMTLDVNERPQEVIDQSNALIEQYQNRPESHIVTEVVKAMFRKSVAFYVLDQYQAAIESCDIFIQKFQDRDEPTIAEWVTWAMLNKGVAFDKLGMPQAAIESYDRLIQKFQDQNEPTVAEPVARAMFYKGATLDKLGMPQAAIESYDRLI